MITADCGGSNGYRVRLWKVELQKLANETGMMINVCHFPPGTSKWNKIEHKMFSFISKNWQGKTFNNKRNCCEFNWQYQNQNGLKLKLNLMRICIKKGREVTDKEVKSVHIETSDFHGEWNYKIKPITDTM